ncbi:acyltransferase family protein [Bacteroides ovatus]|uniref:acyltransferase family protein n=2 Tax=Bacteroides TaxID=816 RepID=UPI001897A898
MNILMDRKNIVWINNIKAICIISVLFIHCQIYYNYFLGCSKFIHPFYVNAFFFISGYLLFRKQMSEQLINQRFGEYVVWGVKRRYSILYTDWQCQRYSSL